MHLRAFRTFEDYQHPGVSADLRESIPAEKITEFGAHANRYYQLAVQYFCTGSEAAILEGILQMGLSQEKDLGYVGLSDFSFNNHFSIGMRQRNRLRRYLKI